MSDSGDDDDDDDDDRFQELLVRPRRVQWHMRPSITELASDSDDDDQLLSLRKLLAPPRTVQAQTASPVIDLTSDSENGGTEVRWHRKCPGGSTVASCEADSPLQQAPFGGRSHLQPLRISSPTSPMHMTRESPRSSPAAATPRWTGSIWKNVPKWSPL